MRQIAQNLRAENHTSRADCVDELISEIETLHSDIDIHKEALNRYQEKLSSVWDGMRAMMRDTLGHESGREPLDDFQVLLKELKDARAALNTVV